MFCVLTSLLPSSLPPHHLHPCSLPTCYRFSHRVNFQRAIYPSSPLTSSAGSRASHHTSWLSSPPCSLHCWRLSHQWTCWCASGKWRIGRIYFFFFLFLDTVGMCRMYPVNFFAFFFRPLFFFFFCHSGFFCPSQKNSGMDQTRISLIWPFFSAVFLFIGV